MYRKNEWIDLFLTNWNNLKYNELDFSKIPTILLTSQSNDHLLILLELLDKYLDREGKRQLQSPQNDSWGIHRWGHIASVPHQRNFYYSISKSNSIERVCEIGFNGGHGSLVFLHSNPNIHLYAFDLNERYYVKSALFFSSKIIS